MKICFITDTYCDINGVSRFLQDILGIANQKDDEVYLLTVTNKKICNRYDKSIILKPKFSFPIPYYKELDMVFPPFNRIKKELDTIQADIIHISTPGIVGFYGRYYAKKNNIPMAGTYHTDFPSYVYKNTKIRLFEKIVKKYMHFFYKDFQILFTRSLEYMKPLTQDIQLDMEKIRVLKAGTDTNKFTPKYKDDNFKSIYSLEENAKIFLYVGRITKEKNIEFLLDIFKNHFKDKDAVLLLAGSGNDVLKHQYETKKIIFLGNKRGEELYTLYANADCFVFPSTTDTLGQVVLEALSSGTPALVSDMGGPKDIINNSKKNVGFVLVGDSKKQWIEMIDNIIENKIAIAKLSSNAREYALGLDILNSYDDFIDTHKLILQKGINDNTKY